MNLLSVHLPRKILKEDIEEALKIRFAKSIEKNFCAQTEGNFLFYAQFDVLTFCGYSQQEIASLLEKLGIPKAAAFQANFIFQDYPLRIDPALSTPFKVSNEEIVLREMQLKYLEVIALVLAQSVGLEHYEKKIDIEFPKSKQIIQSFSHWSLGRRKELMNFAAETTLLRHSIIIDLQLLDKPDILWEDEVAESLYNALSSTLELIGRYKLLEYKLDVLKDDVGMVTAIVNQNRAEFLELVIIILIVIEIIMALFGLA